MMITMASPMGQTELGGLSQSRERLAMSIENKDNEFLRYLCRHVVPGTPYLTPKN